MLEINNILCAIALSENMDMILSRALKEAHMHGANLHILHVLPGASDIMVNPVAIMMGKEKYNQLVKEHLEEIKSSILARIENVKGTLLTGEMEAMRDRISDVIVVEGDPVIQILDATHNLNADMLVIGTHAKGLTEHTFMGDVAHKILKRTRVPVLSVPA